MRRLINRGSLHSLRPLLIHYYPQLFAPGCSTPSNTNSSGEAAGETSTVVTATVQADDQKMVGLESASYEQFLRVLERVVVEHNMLAASLIYTNISLKNLGELLEVDPNQVLSFSIILSPVRV